jgi:iron complex outermembrane recepter protein
MRVMLLLGVSLASLVWSAPVLAQEAEPEVSTRVDDIIVTATRREQNILEVPIAISNFGAEQMEQSGVTDVRKLTALAPSFNFTSSVSASYGAVIRIRGLGTSGSNPGLESATGVYVDGVYRNRAGLAVNDLPGLERVELLRGPQGTLFGKNTTAGVVNILTRRPSFTFGGEGALSYGDYNFIEGRVGVTGPLSETVAGRLDALVQSRDGLIEDYVNGQSYYDSNRYQLRGQLLITPSDTVDIRLIADYTNRDEDPGNAIPYRVATATARSVVVSALLGAPIRANFDAADTDRVVSQSTNDYFDRGYEGGLSAQLDWDLGWASLTGISAWRKWHSERSYDVEGNALDLLNDPFDGETYDTWTHELRLQGEAGPVDWLVGVFYADERVNSRDSYQYGRDLESYLSLLVGGISFTPFTGLPTGQSFRAGAQASLDSHDQHSESFSLFTHNSLSLGERLTLTAGLRYTTEKKELVSNLVSDNPACANAVALNGPNLTAVPAGLRGLLCVPNFDSRLDGVYIDEKSESEWSGTTSADYAFTDQIHGYVSYSRGYKAGGYNLDRAGLAFPNPQASNLRFSPEFADAYEAGLKGVFWDRRLRVSTAAFQTSLSDYQFTYNLLLPSGVPQRVTTNLPELVSKGLELETSLEPMDDLSLTFNATYQDVTFSDDAFPVGLTQLQGTTAPNAPEWLVSGSVSYERPVSETLRAFVYVDARWQDDANVSSSGAVTAEYFQEGYTTVNARIGLGAIDDRWTLELWGRNVFDQAAWTQLVPATLQSGAIYGYLNEPRLYGLTLRSKW